jgi:hypothetical protein
MPGVKWHALSCSQEDDDGREVNCSSVHVYERTQWDGELGNGVGDATFCGDLKSDRHGGSGGCRCPCSDPRTRTLKPERVEILSHQGEV